jgi:phosphoglycerate dehydrogenase-like enzyme
MKAVPHYRASAGFRRRLLAAAPAWLELAVVDENDRAGFTAAIQDAEVLLHVLEPVTAAMIASAPRLRLVQKIGVGVNTIDLAAAHARGVAVANMPGTNSQAVAEHTLLLMLAALRRLAVLDRETRAGRGWRVGDDTFDAIGELAGRNVGLVGFGEVGRRLEPVLRALGACVAYTARAPKTGTDAEFLPLSSLLERSDVVSLHLPLTEATRGLIDAAALARMKPGAILVNTARGALVDEAALLAALRAGMLGGAALDTFAREPAGADDPLFALDSVVVTPHVAWLTPETLERSLAIAFENCRRVRAGEPLLHGVPTAPR